MKKTKPVEGHVWDAAVRVANLFLIFPPVRIATASKGSSRYSLIENGKGDDDLAWREDVDKVITSVSAVLTHTLRQFLDKQTDDKLKEWFGEQA
eukprot:CAMPEP_0197939708 /NCGR_PEP_ID=MMETSP1439-20131203/120100_1 /TAXON_ID=66791 /ORGANISM="Gonyaulax spinifera, Strain CCMP409" /LENGTH=93 /DNA_ID=CAMNT_0043562839 /DNA_START=9 /DNA_END=287 /DNA_ORIENTATION=-